MSDFTFDKVTAEQLRKQGLQEVIPYVKMIENEQIRTFVRKALELAPLYFWIIPASSSGKYHPEWAASEGGLFRHTVLGMYLASEIARTFGCSPVERDIAIAAMAIHDTLKYGIDYDQRYFDMHPYLPRSFYGPGKNGHGLDDIVGKEIFNNIMCAVERHMGSIAFGEWHSVGRMRPEDRVEFTVHLADYIASRKKIHCYDFI